jgi:hypothetical protein
MPRPPPFGGPCPGLEHDDLTPHGRDTGVVGRRVEREDRQALRAQVTLK